MDNLMKMEGFDDVKDLAADISKMEDQVEELRKGSMRVSFRRKDGKGRVGGGVAGED